MAVARRGTGPDGAGGCRGRRRGSLKSPRCWLEIHRPPHRWTQRRAMAWRAGDEAGGAAPLLRRGQPARSGASPTGSCSWAARWRCGWHTWAQIAALLDEIAFGDDDAEAEAAQPAPIKRLREMAQETPVIDFVNAIFAEALARRASDVHIEPFADHFAVRMRIDGMLTTTRTARRERASTRSVRGSSFAVGHGHRRAAAAAGRAASRSASPARNSTCGYPVCRRSGASRWCFAC